MRTDSGVKTGKSIRTLSPADQRIVEGWTEFRGLCWEARARRPGERAPTLIGDERRFQPDQLPPAQQRVYIRKHNVKRYGAEGCPGSICLFLDGSTTLPHRKHAEEEDDQGQDRLEADGRRKREGGSARRWKARRVA